MKVVRSLLLSFRVEIQILDDVAFTINVDRKVSVI